MDTAPTKLAVAYFSMEIAANADIPTYSGGLGILAGDILKSAADMGLSMAGVTLLYRKGYFDQHLDEHGNQTETPSLWRPESVLDPTDGRVTVVIEDRKVAIRAWKYSVAGLGGRTVPIYFLDTALPENSSFDQTLTDQLYGGDDRYRLCQEAVLGLGGVAMLNELGFKDVATYHMNEGHASLLTLALQDLFLEDFDSLRKRCVFTTHTPVPAGHDQFPKSLARQVLGEERVRLLESRGCFTDDILNMTFLGLRGSHYINGVAMQHGEVSRNMFPNYPIRAITNGVHAVSWTSIPFQELYDRHIPEWREDNLYLRYAIGIGLEEIRAAHKRSKKRLCRTIRNFTNVELDENVLTIGFARRAAAYKRADFLFSDLTRLKSIAQQTGRIQVIYAGKAHPRDEDGKAVIRRTFEMIEALKGTVRIVYVPNYDIRWARHITSGVDLWLNTPQRPYEASGTSGMKAALNGIPSLSVPDGWWREGHVEGATGWDIGDEEISDSASQESASLYDKLEREILPLFYRRNEAFTEVMRQTIALNGSFFNTQRMLAQYRMNAYK